MTVSFLDLAPIYAELKGEIDEAVSRVLRSGWYIGGVECDRFEEAFAEFCGARRCVGVGTGLDALQLAVRALNIGVGDEVIVASNSFIATVLAVTMTGAIPIFVEPDPRTSNLDPTRVAKAIGPRTKAIIPTHLYGQPADLDPLLAIARQHGLRLIEDAAQAHGARYRGRRIGGHGDIVCWSFYPSKNLGALGDGGAITTNDDALADRVRLLGNYGSRERYVNDERGTNSRLDPIHAATLSVKLRHLDTWNARRGRIATLYNAKLAGAGVRLPFVPEWAEPSWHLYAIHTPQRHALRAALGEQGVATQLHYPIPPHRQAAYADLGLPSGRFPIAERLAAETLSLPIGPHLSMEDADRVTAAINRWCTDTSGGNG